jgi:predicted O-methyltransferase YrrM
LHTRVDGCRCEEATESLCEVPVKKVERWGGGREAVFMSLQVQRAGTHEGVRQMILPSESVKHFPDVNYVPMQGGGQAQPWMMPIYGQGVEAEMMDLLYTMVRILRPEMVVDLGSHVGMSAYALGCAVRDNDNKGRVVSCDIEAEYTSQTFERVKGLPVAALMCSAHLLREVETADFLFIDCDYGNRIGTLKRIKKGATGVMHDTRQEPILRKAIDDSGLKAVHFDTWRGFSIIQG